MTIWLTITYCLVGALYGLAARRIAIRLGRRSLAWTALAFWAGPLALPVLLMMKPHGTGQSVTFPRLFAVITITLTIVIAGATGAIFLKALNIAPERVVSLRRPILTASMCRPRPMDQPPLPFQCS